MGMMSFWRRRHEPTCLRVELRDGLVGIGYFDTQQEVLDWIRLHIADEEERILAKLSEIAECREYVQDMHKFLTDAEEWENKTGWEGESLREMQEASEPYTQQEAYDHEHPPLRDDPMETER